MILVLYAAAGFMVGFLLAILLIIWANRVEENQAFRNFWMP